MSTPQEQDDEFLKQAIAQANGENSLGNFSNVRGIVQQFIAEFIEWWDDDGTSEDELEAWIDKQMATLTPILFSESEDFEGTAWFTRGNVDRYLKQVLMFGGETPEEVLKSFFTVTVVEFTETLQDMKESGEPPIEIAAHMRAMITLAAQRLMGTDPTIEEDDDDE